MKDNFVSMSIQDKQAKDMLQKLIDRTGKPEAALKSICEYMLMSIDDRWEKQVDAQGNKWKPLSPFTLKMKKSQGRLLPILQSTGIARRTIRYQVVNNKATIGTNLPYMAKHQLGLEGLPKREFLGFSEDDITEIRQILQGFLSRPDRDR